MMPRSLSKIVARGGLFVFLTTLVPPHAWPLADAALAAPAASAASARPADDPVIATVDGLPITASDLAARKRRVESVYTQRTGKSIPPGYDTFFRRSALDELVHDRLVRLDAKATGVQVSDASAESLLQADDDFTKNGRFDAAAYERYKAQNPIGFQDAMRQAKEALAAMRHGEEIERRLDPTPQELDRMWRLRYGSVRAQAVYVPDVPAGSIDEPSDDEVAAEYARHPAEYVWPAQLDYTLMSVITPSLDAAAQKSLVDLALSEARAGLPLDSVAARHGGRVTKLSWAEGQDARGFEGRDALLQKALATPAGTVLSEPVTSAEGFYLIRVDRSRPRAPAPLGSVAGDVRVALATRKLDTARDAEAKKLYDSDPKAWAMPAWQARWASIDSARVSVKPPGDAELEAWYSAHAATFARVDPAGGGVRVPKLSDVRAQAEALWSEEQRGLAARRTADEVATAWSAGKSPKKSDAIRLGGPAWLVSDGPPPAGLASDLADSVRSWSSPGRVLVRADGAGGFDVVNLVKYERTSKATFEMAEPKIVARLDAERAERDRAKARAWYDAHRADYVSGRGAVITYVPVMFPDPSIVNVPGEAIERFYRERKAEVGTPEEVKVRHILVRTGSGTSAQAEARARAILARLRSGNDFATVAKAESDDPLTAANGGDMGWLRRGIAPGPFEEAAFALRESSPLSDVVRTEFGYHIIRLDARRAGKTPSFEDARVEIGRKLAAEYSDKLARVTAARLRDTSRGADDLADRAERERYLPYQETWYEGEPATGVLEDPGVRTAVLTAKPGAILPMTPKYGANQYLVIGIDSVLAPSELPFESVAARALADARRAEQGGDVVTRAQRLEKDLAAGKPWEQAVDRAGNAVPPFTARAGETGPTIPAVPGLDTLLFGQGPGALAPGTWTKTRDRNGTWYVRLAERMPPEPSAEANRERLRAVVLNRRLYDYDEVLRSRHRVVVLDESLSERLPPPPAMP